MGPRPPVESTLLSFLSQTKHRSAPQSIAPSLRANLKQEPYRRGFLPGVTTAWFERPFRTFDGFERTIHTSRLSKPDELDVRMLSAYHEDARARQILKGTLVALWATFLPGQAQRAARARRALAAFTPNRLQWRSVKGLWTNRPKAGASCAPSLLSVSFSDSLHASSGPAVESAPNRCLFRKVCQKAPDATSRTAGGTPRSEANC